MEEFLEINSLMEEYDYFISQYIPHIGEYIDMIDKISKIVLRKIGEYYLENDVSPFQNDDFIEMDIINKIEILNQFFKDKNILFDIKDPFQNGVVELQCRDFQDYSENGLFKEGYNRYVDDKKSIDIYDHGILLDSVTWLHELIHYRNQSDGERSEEGKIFTETISFIYELFYLDFLKENGYPIDDYYLDNLDGEAGMVKYVSPILSLYRVYSKTGEVNIKNFQHIYSKKNSIPNEYLEYYEPSDFSFHVSYVLDSYYGCCCKNDFFQSNLIGMMYSLALPLQIYLYGKYQEDSTILDKIEKLNSIVNSSSFMDCLKVIGIAYPFSDEFMLELEKYTDTYMNQIGDYVKKMEYQKKR